MTVPMDKATYEKKAKQFSQITGPMCKGCGLIWYFEEANYLVCTTCAKPAPKIPPQEFSDD